MAKENTENPNIFYAMRLFGAFLLGVTATAVGSFLFWEFFDLYYFVSTDSILGTVQKEKLQLVLLVLLFGGFLFLFSGLFESICTE